MQREKGGDAALKRKYMIVGFLVFCITASLFMGITRIGEVEAEVTPVVYLDPPSVTRIVGQSFTVDIRIRDLEIGSRLRGWEVKVGYYNIMLEALDCEEGPFLKGFQGPNGTFFMNIFYQESGYVRLYSQILGLPDGDHDGTAGEEEDWPYGTGVLTTVTFNCVKAGECVLDLYDTHLVDADSNVIPHQVEDGYVIVPSPPTVDLNNDGIVDIYDVIIIAGAFGAERVDDPEDPRYGEYWHDPPCPRCPHH
jgi:hypothetical protein